MHESPLQRAAVAAIELQRARPDAPALEILDLALQGPVHTALDAELMHPASPFGQVIAAAFDTAMTPADWLAWAGEGAEHSICDALLRAWSEEVLPKFRSRYEASMA